MLKLNTRLMITEANRKVSFSPLFRDAGILGFGNSGFTLREPGQGSTSKVHSHADAEEMYVTLGGKAIATVNDERVPLEPGDVLIIQPGEQHKIEASPDSHHENLWLEPDRIAFLTPLKDGRQYLARRPEDCPVETCSCGQSTKLITREDTPAANVNVSRITDARRHYHKRCVEYYHVLEGAGTLEIGDDTVGLAPGVTVAIPAGVRHRACGDLRVLIVGVPAISADDEYFD